MRILLKELKPGDAFIYNSCLCMRVNVPKCLQENGMVQVLDNLYTRFTVPYINYKTNDFGFLVEDVVVDMLDLDAFIAKMED